jgi:hypothetical protein
VRDAQILRSVHLAPNVAAPGAFLSIPERKRGAFALAPTGCAAKQALKALKPYAVRAMGGDEPLSGATFQVGKPPDFLAFSGLSRFFQKSANFPSGILDAPEMCAIVLELSARTKKN